RADIAGPLREAQALHRQLPVKGKPCRCTSHQSEPSCGAPTGNADAAGNSLHASEIEVNRTVPLVAIKVETNPVLVDAHFDLLEHTGPSHVIVVTVMAVEDDVDVPRDFLRERHRIGGV